MNRLLATLTKLPRIPDGNLVNFKDDSPIRNYLSSLVNSLIKEFDARTPDIRVRESVLLQSPSGKVFEVKVADDGTLSSTLRYGV